MQTLVSWQNSCLLYDVWPCSSIRSKCLLVQSPYTKAEYLSIGLHPWLQATRLHGLHLFTRLRTPERLFWNKHTKKVIRFIYLFSSKQPLKAMQSWLCNGSRVALLFPFLISLPIFWDCQISTLKGSEISSFWKHIYKLHWGFPCITELLYRVVFSPLKGHKGI